QDRLFQLDNSRRRGAGRLAEILGGDGGDLDLIRRLVGIESVFQLDLLARTVGICRIAEHEWDILPEETKRLVTAFFEGINAFMQQAGNRLPIEFDLLDYKPEPWTPIDCLTIEGEFRWYLTGRFPVIVMPELAKRRLGDGPLYRAFLETEADDESIIPTGSFAHGRIGKQPVGEAAGGPEATGSNNSVLSGKCSLTGNTLLATEPHNS